MKTKAIAAIVAPVLALGTPLVWTKVVQVRSAMLDTRPAHEKAATGSKGNDAHAAPVRIIDAAVPSEAELHAAVEQGIVRVEMRGNGRDWVRARVTNVAKSAITIHAEPGQMFEAGLNAVILVRPVSVDLAAGSAAEVVFQTASTRSANKTTEQTYRLTYGRVPKLMPFIEYVQAHGQLPSGAIQTAILAILENLPLHAVAKFPTVSSGIKSRFNTDAFRAETFDIVMALNALREAGVSNESVVMTVDPQLKIEAMIDPLCRAAAMRYYGITAANEWDYWRRELLEGDQNTRHYALWGIARFYPDIALDMLPKWARETRTTPVFRLTAIQALTETQRPEAIPILRQLADELDPTSELGRAATGAAAHLEERLGGNVARPKSVAFRTGEGTGK
jgi:hypothetical protein